MRSWASVIGLSLGAGAVLAIPISYSLTAFINAGREDRELQPLSPLQDASWGLFCIGAWLLFVALLLPATNTIRSLVGSVVVAKNAFFDSSANRWVPEVIFTPFSTAVLDPEQTGYNAVRLYLNEIPGLATEERASDGLRFALRDEFRATARKRAGDGLLRPSEEPRGGPGYGSEQPRRTAGRAKLRQQADQRLLWFDPGPPFCTQRRQLRDDVPFGPIDNGCAFVDSFGMLVGAEVPTLRRSAETTKRCLHHPRGRQRSLQRS